MRRNIRESLVIPVVALASLLLLGNCTKDEPLSPGSLSDDESMRPSDAPWAGLAAFWGIDDSSSEGCNGTICVIQASPQPSCGLFPASTTVCVERLIPSS